MDIGKAIIIVVICISVYLYGFIWMAIDSGETKNPAPQPDMVDWREREMQWLRRWSEMRDAVREREEASRVVQQSFEMMTKYTGTSREAFYEQQWRADMRRFEELTQKVMEEVDKIPRVPTK